MPRHTTLEFNPRKLNMFLYKKLYCETDEYLDINPGHQCDLNILNMLLLHINAKLKNESKCLM